LNRVPKFEREEERSEREAAQVLVLGSGRVGRHVSDALLAKGVPHAIVDFDSFAIEQRKSRGVPVLYGDATSLAVLKEAVRPRLKLAVVALPESEMARMAIRQIKSLMPELRVIARVHQGAAIASLREAGADTVFHAEFELATGMVRASLEIVGVSDAEVEAYLEAIYERRYRDETVPQERERR
jgi:CPA2 family monovalent cation:H+ antiporter-2